MRLLYVHGGSRWKFDTEGGLYTDTSSNQDVWDRYLRCGSLTVVLRRDPGVYPPRTAAARFNAFDRSRADWVALPDLYRPASNWFCPRLRWQVEREIARQVRLADRVIVRGPGNVYADTALRWARRCRKPCLIEVTGLVWEGAWYYGPVGKLAAPWRELQCRRSLRQADWAVYVTRRALQKRYPTAGASIGCSDVELTGLDPRVLSSRLRRTSAQSGPLVIGTAASLDNGGKGQKVVIRALGLLRRQGWPPIEYRLAGGGDSRKLLACAERWGVRQQVKLSGCIRHDAMRQWYDQLDVYIHPSYGEGLSRAILEAMARACPVLSTAVGGAGELTDPGCLFEPGDFRQAARLLQKMSSPAVRQAQAMACFARAQDYAKARLDPLREAFYLAFMQEGT